ncbi:MAG: sugar phosphate isomerase/epimerase [Clostridium sp.]|jgi:inosose dehydratase|uniref:sugar phosphate isomerase/epimerase family protein n=1 Tax=Clostridium sp. TaxID=1506 RepID=UPI0025BD18C0|nr:sugar phosphate isomerase/epimerase [Clostridium sp.]MCH3964803.1 sugar phosphate isomerase/epimerase [Clostridium sp.]MCI1715274.1 sugar phosphate isomerase/epimerase [Clostridium sp.]MCI1799536.1 sugar phosphate isomerase/epimerase [Clostridium sp.]MCI1813457.1 sugar phosphate isomerase/epimerase [Clostridium sp.]MCI1870348.1 sugar phosphate isomerase/epimerase [Clostridium sp.]
MKIRVGSCPDSWGVWFPKNEKQIPWTRCLDEMAAAGYEGTELGPTGYLPTSYDELKKALDKRGLDLIGATLSGDMCSNQGVSIVKDTIDLLGPIQIKFSTAKYMVLFTDVYTDLNTGKLIHPATIGNEEWKQFCANIQEVSDYARDKYGLMVVYHPHAQTYCESEDEIEHLLNDTDVMLCFDTGHHVYGGGDPVSFFRKHYKRIPYLHLKDCNQKLRDRIKSEGLSFVEAVGLGLMCEPGAGAVDFADMYKALQEVDYDGWAVVEQDMYPCSFDKPFPIAKRTRKFLADIGMK